MLKPVKSILKFILYIVLSLLLALVIRLFLFDCYVVPSDSMEPAILPGDFILADKWTYGARLFTSLQFDEHSDPPIKRIPGLRHIRRNDVVVFNFPCRHGWDTIRMNLEKIYVKRCIGIPGDSLSIIDSYYRVAGVSDTPGSISGQRELARYRGVLDSTIVRTIPFDTTLFHWDIRNFGPLYIPAAGTTIALTPENVALYTKQIVYETGAAVRMEDSSVYINDTLATHYTFLGNWYFMAGDRVMNSQDSRYTGLIPEAYIIGRASLICTSTDRNTGKRRWNRFLKRIK